MFVSRDDITGCTQLSKRGGGGAALMLTNTAIVIAFYEKEKLKGTSAKKRRELLQDMKMPCVYCDRAVNTLFSCKNRIYKAVCGDDKNPCAFHIEIEAGKYTDVISMVNALKIVNIENERETIIKTKMDTLLNYQTENNAVKQFKHNLEEYNESKIFY